MPVAMPTIMPKLRPTWLCQRLCPWLRSQDYANNYTQGDAHNYVYGYAYDYAYGYDPRLCLKATPTNNFYDGLYTLKDVTRTWRFW